MFLVRCRDCGSRLIQPVDVVGPIDRSSIVTRFCPECGRYDVVIANDSAVRTWLRREGQIRARVQEWAHALAGRADAEHVAGTGPTKRGA
jgi:hypothetical protein